MTKSIKIYKPDIDYGLAHKLGMYEDTSSIDKFGLNPSVGSSYETIWDQGGIYAHPSSAGTMTATSASGASDSGIKVTIQGLDTNYAELSEEVTLGATGVATTTGEFLRVFRAFVSGNTASSGDIDIDNGGTTYAYIESEFQQTMMAVYTVPAGYTGYLINANISSLKEKDYTAKLMTRVTGGIFRAQGLLLSPGTPFLREWRMPPKVLEKTDIEIRAKTGTTGAVAAGFELLLVKN